MRKSFKKRKGTSMYKIFFKRIFDFTVALIGLIILSPITIVITVISYFVNNGNPFFFQPRPGKNEKIFHIVKFKTMNDKKDAQGKLLPDSERVNSFGTFLRKSSLDEIPQLFNVIKGDMSIVGPRPLRVRYIPYYTKEEKIRHTVRPGITGLAQVSGRNLLSWDEKLAKDIEYVKNLTIKFDFIILLKTINKVISPRGIETDPSILPLDQLRKDKINS